MTKTLKAPAIDPFVLEWLHRNVGSDVLITDRDIANAAGFKTPTYFIERAYADGERRVVAPEIQERSGRFSHSLVVNGQHVTLPNSAPPAGENLRAATAEARRNAAHWPPMSLLKPKTSPR